MKAWIGLCEVRPCANNTLLEGAVGAYVNVLGLGSTESDFLRLVVDTMKSLEFEVIALEDVGSIEERESTDDLIPELSLLAKSLTRQNPIQFDEFQAFDE